MLSWEYCARLTSPYWPPIVLRAFLRKKTSSWSLLASYHLSGFTSLQLLISPYWPHITLAARHSREVGSIRAYSFNKKNVLLVFDFPQVGINLRNWTIHCNNNATIIAIIFESFQAFWRGWLNPRGRCFPLRAQHLFKQIFQNGLTMMSNKTCWGPF